MADLIERCSIRADGPGLIVYEELVASSPRRKVRLGDRVTPSQGIVRVVDVARMQVDTSVPERSIHRIRRGQSATVRLEAFPGLILPGQVRAVGALARTPFDAGLDGKRFDVTVELDPTAEDLRPEMTARVDILVEERPDVVRLPINAVFEREGLSTVNVLRGNRVEARQVDLGEQNRRFVEVLAGVAESERVLLTGGTPALADAAAANGNRETLSADFGDLLGEGGDVRLGSLR